MSSNGFVFSQFESLEDAFNKKNKIEQKTNKKDYEIEALKNVKNAEYDNYKTFTDFLETPRKEFQEIKDVSKVLYLDCDMILLGDIKDLWAYDVSPYVAAVVKDAADINLSHLGKLTPKAYFNSGMMLINLEQWKKNKIQDKLFKLLDQKIHFRFHDQDLLNLALNNKVSLIDPKWNMIPSRSNKYVIKYIAIITRLRLENAFMLNAIIHFAASKKPWHYLSSHPLKFLWWKHLRRTEFSNFVPEDKNLFNFFYKICPKPLRFLLSR
jgi:lipopolysaccharide biosynthesis glycosyltransferase